METLKLAISFLTIIPVRFKDSDINKTAFRQAIKYFPLVGLIIGLFVAVIGYVLQLIEFNPFTSSVLLVILLMIITRMLHIDGLADTFDGLFGGKDKESALRIMKDSNVGSFGVTAIVCVLIAKIALISQLLEMRIQTNTLLFQGSYFNYYPFFVVILMPVIGRWSAALCMLTQVSARETGLGATFADDKSNLKNSKVANELIVPTIFTIAVAGVLLKIEGVIVFITATLFSILFLKWVNQKIGGITGDIAGALIELNEVIVVLVFAIFNSFK